MVTYTEQILQSKKKPICENQKRLKNLSLLHWEKQKLEN